MIQPNLAAWLRAYPLKKFPIIPANLQHIREKVAEQFPLAHDVMRHSYISFFVAKFRSIGGSGATSGQFRERGPQTLSRFENDRRSGAVLRHPA